MSDKGNNDPQQEQASISEAFTGEQVKPLWVKEEPNAGEVKPETVQWDELKDKLPLNKAEAVSTEEGKVEPQTVQWDKLQLLNMQKDKWGDEKHQGDDDGKDSKSGPVPDPIELLRKIGLDWRSEKAKPPSDPVFEHATGGMNADANAFVSPTDRERMNTLLRALPYLHRQFEQGGRAERFYPYLLIRTVVGDRGNRPLNPSTPPTASPDIWIVPGEPQSNPDLSALMSEETALEPPSYAIAPRAHGFDRDFSAGQPHTVYAHVWNLGRAPIIGVRVEFVYAWTSFSDEVSAADKHQSLGFARLDLGPRTSPHCHRLVKCPQPLIPRSTNCKASTHLLIAKVSCIGDGVTDPWRPLNDRHVAFHFLNVVG